jgi:4,5-dihydroxyphthalate decarboxylase
VTLSLSLACTDYEWLEPLARGQVAPEGVDLTVLTDMGGGERHWRAMHGEFDVAEFSMGTYITGWPDWDFTAIPAFPRRFFPHSRTFLHRDAGVSEPADLEGKRVLITSYQNTLALWMKGIYAEHYGLDLAAVDWVAWKDEPVPVDLPVDLDVLARTTGRAELLSRGEVDALVIPATQEMYPLPENVSRMYDDLEPVERAYYEETGFYPLMHNVVVRDDLVADHPWLPTELLKAFRRSADAFAERAAYEAKYPLVWWQPYREREAELFGDVWGRSFEFEANADEVETMIGYAADQGLIDAPHDPEDLFLRVDEHLL